MFKAKIINESTAGLIALEIYDGKNMVWSRHYHDPGDPLSWDERLQRVISDAERCDEWALLDGGTTPPVVFNDRSTTYVVMEFSRAGGWQLRGEWKTSGLASDLMYANRNRLPPSFFA